MLEKFLLISELASSIRVQMLFAAISPAVLLAVIISIRIWNSLVVTVEMSLLLSVEVGGRALVGGGCWDWVETGDCRDWLMGGLGVSVGGGELCWVGVEGSWWFEVVVTELVSDGEWLWIWVGADVRWGWLGWAVEEGRCWVWVGADVWWGWWVEDLVVFEVDVCWSWRWSRVGVSVEEWLWVWVGIGGCWLGLVLAGSALERLDGNGWRWIWVGIGGCWLFGLAPTGSASEEGDKDGRWIWVWFRVEDCCWFGTAIAGLALEKRVGDGFCWTFDFRSASSDVGRTLTDSLDCLM